MLQPLVFSHLDHDVQEAVVIAQVVLESPVAGHPAATGAAARRWGTGDGRREVGEEHHEKKTGMG